MKRLMLVAACTAVSLSLPLQAKVSAEEAARLGQDLTRLGAEKAGNAAGTIPAFSGKLPDFPKEVYTSPGKHLPNPYKDEKPILVITADNYKQHSDQLTAGLIAQFEKYPTTFKMKIYPTHRDGLYDERNYTNAVENATRAELVDGGNGIIGAFGGAPFPIPQDAQEAIWNQLTRTGAFFTDTIYDGAAVYAKGRTQLARVRIRTIAPYQNLNNSLDDFKNMVGYQIIDDILPKRKAGEVTLIHEPLNQAKNPRSAWKYMPSTRRVRRAPVVAFDYPVGPGGLIYADEGRIFNGAIDRYDWKLLGKAEKYIPYNNYDMDNPELTYDELLTKGHINPEPMRYELHRVWVIEATKKADARHVIGKREFYLDEDSWNIQLADAYDNRGNLWRTSMQTMVIHPLVPGPYGRLWVYNDLSRGDYVVDHLVNELDEAERFDRTPLDLDYFTPQGIRMNVRR
ncbi:MAG: DUF1329 domain-containing protein [Pseudomonadales bacterium]|nr:DUF1329 domain-containing protein [Pseudomonadales bacterium]